MPLRMRRSGARRPSRLQRADERSVEKLLLQLPGSAETGRFRQEVAVPGRLIHGTLEVGEKEYHS